MPSVLFASAVILFEKCDGRGISQLMPRFSLFFVPQFLYSTTEADFGGGS
jgi:hypothetical protein